MFVSAFDLLLHHSQTDLINAYQELSAQGVLTPVDALKKNKLIAAAIVSFKISREADVNNTGGELTFGFVLLLHYTDRNVIYFFFLAE